MDWDGEGLLDGLEGEAREDRRRLLERLHGDGVPLEELRQAVAADRLTLLPVERAIMAPPRWTLSELAREAGVEPEYLARIRRALGLPVADPGEKLFGEDDLTATRRQRLFLESGLPEEDLLGVIRVLSSGMARYADAVRGMFGAAFLEAGDSEHDLALRYAEMTKALLPNAIESTEYVFRLQLREQLRHDAIDATERLEGRFAETEEVAVAFADLVGFTQLGEEVESPALGGIASRLTDLASARAKAPTRLVKTIGDAVMLVSSQPAALLDAVLALVADVEDDDALPPLRAGISFGAALPSYGDWYGSAVNVASRLTGRARPYSVLVTAALKDVVAADDYHWSFAGEKRLKGISAPVPTWRVRRGS